MIAECRIGCALPSVKRCGQILGSQAFAERSQFAVARREPSVVKLVGFTGVMRVGVEPTGFLFPSKSEIVSGYPSGKKAVRRRVLSCFEIRFADRDFLPILDDNQ
jgi:hypothetical protein